MSIEIERKFLVSTKNFPYTKSYDIIQGYLFSNRDIAIRIRIVGDKAYQTIKTSIDDISKHEIEYSISVDEATHLLKYCERVISKTRCEYISSDGLTWEIDVFSGSNEGLILAEVELKSKEYIPSIPDFIGREVTGDASYYNCNLKGDKVEK